MDPVSSRLGASGRCYCLARGAVCVCFTAHRHGHPRPRLPGTLLVVENGRLPGSSVSRVVLTGGKCARNEVRNEAVGHVRYLLSVQRL